MKNYTHKATIAVATVLEHPLVPKGRHRHQLDFGGTTGTVDVEVDFGTGYRLITTVDLTEIDRVPFCVEADVEKFRLTPSASRDMAYFVNEVD